MKKCSLTGIEFEITPEEKIFYDRIGVPEPNLCPVERSRRRLAFRNLRYLYRRKCDATGKNLITCYSPDAPMPVYDREYWWSDQWDPPEYGQSFDFNRTFFEQFRDLYFKVPAAHQFAFGIENCDYCNGLANCKDCYLSFGMDYCENCLYLTDGRYCINCLDCLGIVGCELCYECFHCSDRCYDLRYSQECSGCSGSLFLTNCHQCFNCIGCVNLVQKDNYILNKKVSSQEITIKKKELENGENLRKFNEEFNKFKLEFPKKYYYGQSNENFSGDDIRHARNSYSCFYCDEIENCRYCTFVFKSDNCQDYDTFGEHSSWIYDCVATGDNCTNDIFCMQTWQGSSNNAYCNFIVGATDCLGCSGLRHRQYCILNKQYSSEEYFKLKEQIIEYMKKTEEWGEFFPAEMSPFGYNETLANEYYMPLTKEDIEKRGWKWREIDDKLPKVEKIIDDPNILPKDISDVPDAILQWAIICKKTRRPFMIQRAELEFYRKMKIPLPHEHPEARHNARLQLRNKYSLYSRKCDKCGTEMKTTYTPERPEKIYCEECYKKEIY
ncbi:MAG: hypothetical protein NTZ80_00490 [Patescibacteria group bacterium]|nr:hypothetical protein [Patescibacteria group bacterium]